MDYKKTLNLPLISFPMKADPKKTESEIISLWESLNVYEKRQKVNKGNPKYLIYTSPQQADGNISANISFNMVLNDIMIKYKLMNGFDVPNIPIWNSYVPDIEREVIQLLIDNKNSELDLPKNDETHQDQFRKMCREFCLNSIDSQKELLQRLGIFANWNKAILTSDNNYESEVIENFGILHESGYLRKGTKPRFWCLKCESDIDNSEIEYRGQDLLSLHVKFPVMQGLEELGENLFILVWTNKPWTLSTIKPIIVHPDYEYSAVKIENNTILIMADNLVHDIMEKYVKEEYSVIKRMKGSELVNIVCSHPLIYKNLKVLQDKHVSLEIGTGCVYNLSGSAIQDDSDIDISITSPDEISISDSEEYYNGKVFEPSNPVSIELEKRGYLLSSALMEQMYPHCVYCKQPLLVKSNEYWLFDFNANHLKQHTIKALNNVKWLSDGDKKRISGDIANRKDWRISRKRIWGLPIPVFYCEECDLQLDVTESIKSYKAFANTTAIKPNDILLLDTACSNCGTYNFRWTMDTLNPDFMQILGYKTMFWNQKDQSINVDISINSDNQSGKWVPLSLLFSMAIDGDLPFKSAVIHGPVNDTDEISVKELVDKFGAEIFRLCAVSTDSNKHLKITDSHAQSALKSYNRIRNILRFLTGNLSDYEPEDDFVDYEHLYDIDRWILHRLTKLINEVTNAIDGFQFHKAFRLIYNFCSLDVSKTYFSIIKRRLYAFPKWSIGRRAILTVIHEVVTTIVRLIAPVLSFTADDIWRYIPGVKNDSPSVYLTKWPEVKEEYIDDELELQWNFLLKVRNAIYKAFEKNRQNYDITDLSQASITLYTNSEASFNILDKNVDIIAEVFMVSKIRIMPIESPIPDGIYTLEELNDLSMEIRQTNGRKCERCLIYSDAVGTSELYPTLCDRCISVLEGETY
jgi:isoleucyl-tRNA synthetase